MLCAMLTLASRPAANTYPLVYIEDFFPDQEIWPAEPQFFSDLLLREGPDTVPRPRG